MKKERRKKRSHAEVVAAREAYAKEKHDKEIAKAAKKAEREKLAAERAERRAAREARKNMTSAEIQADRYKRKVEKSRKNANVEQGPKWDTYKGNINVGDFVAAIFAGCPVKGTVIAIDRAEDYVDNDEESPVFRKGVSRETFYIVEDADDKTKYPIIREKIIAKR